MEKEFNLSKEREELFEIILHQRPTAGRIYRIIKKQDKEFIKKLKEDTGCQPINSREKQIIALFKERIDRLAGDL